MASDGLAKTAFTGDPNVVGLGGWVGATVEVSKVLSGRSGEIRGRALENMQAAELVAPFLESWFDVLLGFPEREHVHVAELRRVEGSSEIQDCADGRQRRWVGNESLMPRGLVPQALGGPQADFIARLRAEAPTEAGAKIVGGGAGCVGREVHPPLPVSRDIESQRSHIRIEKPHRVPSQVRACFWRHVSDRGAEIFTLRMLRKLKCATRRWHDEPKKLVGPTELIIAQRGRVHGDSQKVARRRSDLLNGRAEKLMLASHRARAEMFVRKCAWRRG